MPNKVSRAIRRAQRERMYRRARFVIENFWWYSSSRFWPHTEQQIHSTASRVRDNMKSCSCWMCRNPRRSGKGAGSLTIQELKNLDKFLGDLGQVDSTLDL